MWVKSTPMYCAGFLTGAGFTLFLLFLVAQGVPVSVEGYLRPALGALGPALGALGLALVVAGGLINIRLRSKPVVQNAAPGAAS